MIFLIWLLQRQVAEKYLWSSPVLVWAIAGAVLMLIFSKALAWILSRSDRRNAAEVDRLYGLKERISTFVELKGTQHPFLDPLIYETSPKLTDVSAIRSAGVLKTLIFPLLLPGLLFLSILVLPYLPVPQSIVSKKQDQKRIAEKASEMEKFAQKLEKKHSQNPELKRLAGEFKKVAQELQKPQVDRVEALKKLNSLEEKQKKMLAAHQKKMSADLQKAVEKAMQNSENANEKEAANRTAEQQKEIEQLSQQLKEALQGDPATGQRNQQNLKPEKLSSKDIANLKKAIENYNKGKEQAEKMRAEMKNALDGARKPSSSGKGDYTTDSRLKERDMEKGKGGVEDGPGTTNLDSGPSHFDTKKKGKEQYMEDRTKAQYERLYQGQRENAGKDPLYLESRWDNNGNPQYTNVRNFGLDKESASGSTGALSSKQNQGESAQKKERVPPSHEKIVKEYFEGIEEK